MSAPAPPATQSFQPALLLGRVIVVTGAGRGIGRAIVQHLLQRGAYVAALDIAFPLASSSSSWNDDNDDDDDKKKKDKQQQQQLIQLSCDVTVETAVTETMQKVVQHFGRLDGLVNNAGVILEKPITETTVDDFEKTIGVNLRATFLCARTAVVQFQKQASSSSTTTTILRDQEYPPRIVNIASEIGHSGLANYTVYTASKGAIYAFTRSLALELASQGILVNNVAPGPTDTPMLQSEQNYPAWKQGEGIPLGRLARPDDIAKAVCFLLGPDATFITGSTIDVNGGAVMV